MASVEPFEELTAQEVPASNEQNLNDTELMSRAIIRDAGGATYAHADWTSQLEAYRRMPILLSRLDSALSKILIRGGMEAARASLMTSRWRVVSTLEERRG